MKFPRSCAVYQANRIVEENRETSDKEKVAKIA